MANTEIDDETKHSRLLKLFLKSDSFYDEMFPALSNAMKFYKDTERGREAVSEVTKQWEQEGYNKGFAQGAKQTIISLLQKGKLSLSEAASELGLSESDTLTLLKESESVNV